MGGEKNAKDLLGARFGRLVVIEKTNRRTSGRHVIWRCKCDCGNECFVQSNSLTTNKTKSCGCLIIGRVTHHQSGTKLYDVWCAAKARCNNPKNKNYKHYGGRGIKVCDEWENSFQAFYEWAMANGYKEGLSIDRIDNDGNYEPANCRWVTQEEQCNNRRTSHKLTYEGETHTITEWSKITGIKRKIISQRVNNLGWSIERALTEKEE